MRGVSNILWTSDIISDFEWTSLHITSIDTQILRKKIILFRNGYRSSEQNAVLQNIWMLIDRSGWSTPAPGTQSPLLGEFLVFHCIFMVALWYKRADISNTSDLISDYEWTSLADVVILVRPTGEPFTKKKARTDPAPWPFKGKRRWGNASLKMLLVIIFIIFVVYFYWF